MKILLFGASGYIGTEFVNQLQYFRDIETVCVHSRKSDGSQYSYRELSRLVVDIAPTVIINCAAYIGNGCIANCENNKDQTILSNVIFPQMLGEICNGGDIVFGHISSGCLYNWYVDGGYKESHDKQLTFKSECSFYTGTKALAEDLLKDVSNKYIWRVRLPFDEQNHPRNYLTKLLTFDRLINYQNSISNKKELVRACIECLIKEVPFGIYHVTNPGAINASDIVTMAKKILKLDKEFAYFDSIEEFDKVRKIVTSNTLLNTDKLMDAGIKMTPVHDSVEWSFKNWKS
jgi:dTDP-4-dehydrorhamnose reductase